MANAMYVEFDEKGQVKRDEECVIHICPHEKPKIIEISLPVNIKRNSYYKSIEIPIKSIKFPKEK